MEIGALVKKRVAFQSGFMPPVKLMDVCTNETGAVSASGSCLKMFGQEAPELQRLKVKILRKVNSCSPRKGNSSALNKSVF